MFMISSKSSLGAFAGNRERFDTRHRGRRGEPNRWRNRISVCVQTNATVSSDRAEDSEGTGLPLVTRVVFIGPSRCWSTDFTGNL